MGAIERPPTRRQVERRNRILATASEMATEGGYDALQMRTLADRSGVALATIYKYFDSKDQVLIHLIRQSTVEVMERLGSVAPAGSTPADQVVDVFRRVHRWMDERPKLVAASILALNVASELPPSPGGILTDQLSEVYVPALQELDPERLERIVKTLRYAWRTLMRDWVRDLITIDDVNREIADIVHLLLDAEVDGA
jgi:TetR/AcrR family transcriptional regulator, cholesterol catabolism regulator